MEVVITSQRPHVPFINHIKNEGLGRDGNSGEPQHVLRLAACRAEPIRRCRKALILKQGPRLVAATRFVSAQKLATVVLW